MKKNKIEEDLRKKLIRLLNKNGFSNKKICFILDKKDLKEIFIKDIEKLEKAVDFPLVMELSKYLAKTTKDKSSKNLYKALYNGMKICKSFRKEIMKVRNKLREEEF